MEAVSEVLIVVSSLWEMPSVEESTADLTKERLMVILHRCSEEGSSREGPGNECVVRSNRSLLLSSN